MFFSLLFLFIKKGFIQGVGASLIMQRNNASKSLFYFYFNLRQDYSNLLCMKEKGLNLNLNKQDSKK
jgi:hypothetical protein